MYNMNHAFVKCHVRRDRTVFVVLVQFRASMVTDRYQSNNILEQCASDLHIDKMVLI